jgi:hypothetical protein
MNILDGLHKLIYGKTQGEMAREDVERLNRLVKESDERLERERAEARAKAERNDRIDQDRENFQRAEALVASFQTESIPFKKPTAPTLSLTNKLSSECVNCDIVIPPGLSSSTVILSRNIIGKQPKVILAPKPIPPGKYEGTKYQKSYVLNYMVPENPYDPLLFALDNFEGEVFAPVTYKCAFPNKKFPEVWVNGRPAIAITKKAKEETPAQKIFNEQNLELTKNIDTIKNPDLHVVLWNPSEKNSDKGAVAVNYKTHGALTKVFLKPTIPFSITYGINADVEKAERKEKERLKKKKEAEDKKKKKEEEEAKKAEGK